MKTKSERNKMTDEEFLDYMCGYEKEESLSELKSNATYSYVDLEVLNELRMSKNPKAVYDSLFWNTSDYCYSNFADSILLSVKKYCEGFIVNIAEKYLDVSNKREMSEKQRWAIAYAFIKIEKELGEEIL